jgi:thioredoxin-related protein
MKKILFTALPASILLMALNIVSDPLPLGSPIPSPEVKMKDISGKTVSLKDAKTDKGLLVMFSCNTCPYVIKNQGRTKEVCEYAAENGIGIAIINSNEANRNGADSYDAMKEYAKKQSYNWLYLVDEKSAIADAFGANRTPECFLFDSNGKLVYHGAIDDNPSDASSVSRKHLTEAIDEMKVGKEISVKQSKSVGCSIKRL